MNIKKNIFLQRKSHQLLCLIVVILSAFTVSCQEYAETCDEARDGNLITFSVSPTVKCVNGETRSYSNPEQTGDGCITVQCLGDAHAEGTRGTLGDLTLIENDNFNEQVKELTVYAIKEGDTKPFYDGVILVNDGKGNFDYKDPSQAKDWPQDGKKITFYVGTEGVLDCSGTNVTAKVNTNHDQLYYKSEPLDINDRVVNVTLGHLCAVVYFQSKGEYPEGANIDYLQNWLLSEGKWDLDSPEDSGFFLIGGTIDNLKCGFIGGEYKVDANHYDRVVQVKLDNYYLRFNLHLEAGKKYVVTFDKSKFFNLLSGVATLSDGFVDMGTSVKWSSRNLGASTPTDIGDYYAWGEIKPRRGSGWDYNFNSQCPYWSSGTNSQTVKYTKYVPKDKSSYASDGVGDDILTLQSTDDAVTVSLGKGYRMPTVEDVQELNKVTSSFEVSVARTTVKGSTNIDDYTNRHLCGLVASNITKKCILFPYGGYRFSNYYYLSTSFNYASYWTSSLCASTPYFAYSLGAYSRMVSTYARHNGLNIRPVQPK